MNFHSSAAALLAAVLLCPTAEAKPATNTTTQHSWQYIIDADDGTLYFGRNIRHHEGITFVEIKSEGDPQGDNGDEASWVQPLRCGAKTYMETDRTWHAIERGSVGEHWLQFACESRTNLSDRKGVAA